MMISTVSMVQTRRNVLISYICNIYSYCVYSTQIREQYFFLRSLASFSSPRNSTASMMEDQAGGRVHSLQPHLQHPHEALVSNGPQGGHGQVEVDADVLPLVRHCVVHIWCFRCSCVHGEKLKQNTISSKSLSLFCE